MDLATDDGAIESRIENFLAAQDEPREEVQPEAQAEGEEVEEPVAEEGEGEQEPETDAQEQERERLELAELAEYLGFDADKLDSDEEGRLYIKTKVDGEEGRATLADLVKSYQLEGHLNKQNMEVAEKQKTLSAKMEALERQAQDRLQQLDDLANIAWNELNREYQSIDWRSLRSENPAEFAAMQADFQQRQQHIQKMHQSLTEQRNQAMQKQTLAQQEFIAEQQKRLMSELPEWADENVATRERDDIRKYALGNGFTADELNNVTDARHVVLLRKAMLYDNLQKTKASVTKQVKKAPKAARPGRSRDKSERDANSLKQLRASIRKTGGDRRSVAEYLLKTGKV